MTERRPKPFVGISGVTNERKILPNGLEIHEPPLLWLEAHAKKEGLSEAGRQLLLGVKARHANQYQDTSYKRKIDDAEKIYGPEWFPVGEEAFRRSLEPYEKHPDTLGTAQVRLHPLLAENARYRDDYMNRIALRGSRWLRAVQFDGLRWHENDSLLKYAQETRQQRGFQTILQCDSEQMFTLKPEGVVRKLGEFAASIDYVQFDASDGRGIELEADRLSPFLEAAYNSDDLKEVNFAVAGGLDAASVPRLLSTLLQRFPELSVSAEAKLHLFSNIRKEPVHLDTANLYLSAVIDQLSISS